MKKKLIILVGGAMMLTGAAIVGINGVTPKVDMSLFTQNVQALAQAEELPGKVCYYSGTSTYGDWIPCTAAYPNIGKCGTRTNGYYSTDKAQCYE